MLKRVAVFALVLLAPITVHAQKNWSEKDRAELNAWKLTMERVRQVDRAMTAFGASVQADPEHQARIKREAAIEAGEVEPTEAELAEMEKEEAEDEREGDSLAAMEKKIAQVPKFAAAVKSAGMTTREFVLTQMALFQASFTYGMQKAGHLKEIPKEIPAHQVAFVAEHWDEIQQYSKKWQEMNDRFRGK